MKNLDKNKSEADTIDVYERAPGMAPTKMKKDDLIVITSSKKQDEKRIESD